MKKGILALLLAITQLTFARPGNAQANPDSVKHRNDCRLAAQAITTGHPAPRLDWAWMKIATCPAAERVEVYLEAVHQVRNSSDLRLLHRSIMPVVWFRDGRLFQEVLDLAGDPHAAVPARVVAFVALARIARPQSAASYEKFVGGVDVNGLPLSQCGGHISHWAGYVQGPIPMPSDTHVRINALAARIARDAGNPQDVRSAAACTY